MYMHVTVIKEMTVFITEELRLLVCSQTLGSGSLCCYLMTGDFATKGKAAALCALCVAASAHVNLG